MEHYTNLQLLTQGLLLQEIVKGFQNAKESIFIVGPWLDAYFTGIVVNSLVNREVPVKFIVRVDDGIIDKKTLSALNLAQKKLENFQARSLDNLHSKIIVIDRKFFFLGSANWYWYSLNKGVEVNIKGSTDLLPEIILEIEKYWKDSSPIDLSITDFDSEPVKEIFSRI